MPINTIRLYSVELTNFKNVAHGKVTMKWGEFDLHISGHADVLGIYGQNGSGKTSIVQALKQVQQLAKGNTLKPSVAEYIAQGKNEMQIKVVLRIDAELPLYWVEYTATIARANILPTDADNTETVKTNAVYVSGEKLAIKGFSEGKWETIRTLIDYSSTNEGDLFSPKYRWDKATKESGRLPTRIIDFKIARMLSKRDGNSFIFAKEHDTLFRDFLVNDDKFLELRETLRTYFNRNFFVVTNECTGVITSNIFIPVSFRLEAINKLAWGTLPIALEEPTVLDAKAFSNIENVVKGISKVLQTIVPGLELAIKNYGPQLTKEGTEGVRFELLSVRDGVSMPIRCESDGIIKLISILHLLTIMYANESICVVVDELDSGIFEYLLGELLSILQEGKGQLIFTSHNLRALEVLDKNSLMFSTSNPDNRYIHLKNIKENNNLRDTYYRAIVLGGQDEELYASTKSHKIRRAFRNAGGGLNAQE